MTTGSRFFRTVFVEILRPPLLALALACVASFSVGFSFRSRRFSLFGGAKIGANAKLMEACARPNFHGFKKRKMLQTCGTPYGNACYAGYPCSGSWLAKLAEVTVEAHLKPNLVPRVLSLPPSRKYPGFGWSRGTQNLGADKNVLQGRGSKV